MIRAPHQTHRLAGEYQGNRKETNFMVSSVYADDAAVFAATLGDAKQRLAVMLGAPVDDIAFVLDGERL